MATKNQTSNGKDSSSNHSADSASKHAPDGQHAELLANLKSAAASSPNTLLALVQSETAELFAQTGEYRKLVTMAMEQVDTLEGLQEIDKPLQRQFQLHQQGANYVNLILRIQQVDDKRLKDHKG